MKKNLLSLVVVLTAAVMNVLADDELPGLKLPSIDYFLQQHPAPLNGREILTHEDSVTWLDTWKNDSVLYFQYKERSHKNDQINYDSVWAAKNESYSSVLYRLTADSVMKVPLATNIQKETLSGNWPVNVTFSANSGDFPTLIYLYDICEQMKSHNTPSSKRVRQRPFCYFDDWYNSTHYSHTSSGNRDSYPSGHGYFRGLFGRCLQYIDPENDAAVQAMMDEWLHCRLQKGAHWFTDIVAGTTFGEMAFDTAMTCEAFRQLVFDARQELRDYRGEPVIPEVGDDQADIETVLAAQLNTTTDFTLNRTLYKDGAFNTLSLPFSLASLEGTPLAGGNLYEFQNADVTDGVLSLNVTPADNIVAGRPYLISWPAGDNIYSMTFEDVTITASSGQTVGNPDGIQFVGTLGQAAMTTQTSENFNQLFLGANNTLYWPNANNSLKGFRAYFLVNNSVVTSGAPARIVMRDNGTTAIDQTPFPSEEGRGEAYKLLRNGRLVIIKNGTRYNAQGQMIK